MLRVLRTSDDFFPFEPEAHRFHVAFNATTAFLFRFLSLTPDFDMFTTHHDLAHYHAQLRAFSNAPLYITDDRKPNADVIHRLGGMSTGGEYTLVKAKVGTAVKLPNTAFIDVTGDGEGPALKVGLAVEEVSGALIGIWNCRSGKASTTDVLTTRDVADALAMTRRSRGDYAVCFNESTTVTLLLDLDVEAERNTSAWASKILAPIRLEGETCTTVSIAPVVSLGAAKLAVFGLLDKYASLCAISSFKEEDMETDQQKYAEPSDLRHKAISALSSSSSGYTTEQIAKQDVPRSSSRLWTLFSFLRSDIRAIRATLLRDFRLSPLLTLYREVMALFSGATASPANAGSPPPSTESMGHKGMHNGMGKEVATISEENKLARKDRKALTIETSVTGKLAFMMVKGDLAEYSITIQGNEVDEKCISKQGDCYVLDMDSATSSLQPSGKISLHGWRVRFASKF